MTTTEEKKPPRFMALRRFLFHNFWLKVLALALAVIIYLTLRDAVGKDGNRTYDRETPAYNLKDKVANADR